MSHLLFVVDRPVLNGNITSVGATDDGRLVEIYFYAEIIAHGDLQAGKITVVKYIHTNELGEYEFRRAACGEVIHEHI